MCSAHEDSGKEGESERQRKERTQIQKKVRKAGSREENGGTNTGKKTKSAATVRALKFITAADTAEGHSFVLNRTAQLIIDGGHGVTKIRNR